MVLDSGPIAAPVRGIARETVAFLAAARPDHPTSPAATPALRRSGAGLARLGRLLALQLASHQPDVLCLTGRTVLETWLGAHAAVLLGDDGVTVMAQRAEARRRDAGLGSAVAIAPDPAASGPAESPAEPTTLAGLARRLDLALYGVADPPKAFQRHLRSFFDEVDVFAVEAVDDPEAARPADHRRGGGAPNADDHVRVSLWVTLFLAHDHFAADGRPGDARRARSLFDRLRAATDGWYAERRAATG